MAASCPQKVQQRALAFSTTRVATCCASTKTWCATALITVAMSLTRVPPWTVPCQVSLHNLSSLLIHHRSREASIGAPHALSFEGKFTCHRHDAEKRRLLVVCARILNPATLHQTIFWSRSQDWGCSVETVRFDADDKQCCRLVICMEDNQMLYCLSRDAARE